MLSVMICCTWKVIEKLLNVSVVIKIMHANGGTMSNVRCVVTASLCFPSLPLESLPGHGTSESCRAPRFTQLRNVWRRILGLAPTHKTYKSWRARWLHVHAYMGDHCCVKGGCRYKTGTVGSSHMAANLLRGRVQKPSCRLISLNEVVAI